MSDSANQVLSAAECGDGPYPALADTTGLARVDFGVIPHFTDDPTQQAALARVAARLGSST